MSDEKDSDKKVRIAAVSNEDNSHLSNAELNKLYPNTYKNVFRFCHYELYTFYVSF